MRKIFLHSLIFVFISCIVLSQEKEILEQHEMVHNNFTLLNIKEYNESSKYLNSILNETPSELFKLHFKSYIYQKSNNIEKAIEIYNSMLKEYKKYKEYILCNLAICYMKLKDYRKSKEIIKLIFYNYPNFSLSHIIMGDIYIFALNDHMSKKKYRIWFDDKLVAGAAYAEYFKAKESTLWGDLAKNKMQSIESLLPYEMKNIHLKKRDTYPHCEFYNWVDRPVEVKLKE